MQLCPAPGIALNEVSTPASAAAHARRVMMNEDSFPDAERTGITSASLDDAHRLVAEDEWCFALDVPTHRLTRADAACGDAHEQFAVARRSDRHVAHGNSAVAVVNGR